MELSKCTTSFILGAMTFAAHAQSNVKLYGSLDAGVEYNSAGAFGDRGTFHLNSGNLNANRMGILSSEDLGGGLQAVANLEMGFNVSNGGIVTYGENSSTFWARRSVVGLRSTQWGDLFVGRDYTPAFFNIFQTDRFRFGLPGTISSFSGLSVSRANNGVFWTSPRMRGITARVSAATSDATASRGRFVAGSLEYRSSNLLISVAAQKRKEPDYRPNTGIREYGGGVEYSFSPFVVTAGTWLTRANTSVANAVDKSRAYWIGLGYEIAGGQLNIQVARTSVSIVGRGSDGHALSWGIGYVYPLSKSTALYVATGRVNNDDGARLSLNSGSQRVGGSVFGSDPHSVLVGMRLWF